MAAAESKRTDRVTFIRMVVSFCVFGIMALLVIGSLAKYMIVDYDYYESQVLNQVTSSLYVSPERGDILDRNGNVLATNKTVYTIVISPADIIERKEADDKKNGDDNDSNDVIYDWVSDDMSASYKGKNVGELIAVFLSDTLDVEYDEIIKKEGLEKRKYEVVKKDVEETTYEKISDFISSQKVKNLIYSETSFKRYYPYGNLACHVIGFVGAEGRGVSGLEQYYNDVLEGKSGKYVVARDAHNNEMPHEFEAYVDTVDGSNLVTTLDLFIQQELERQLDDTYHESKAGNRVTGIVMDVETNGILAMATYPSFDLNDPYKLDEDSLEILSEYTEGSEEYESKYYDLLYTMWKNKAVTELYEPGSTFKIITTSMALEEKACSFDTGFYCGGSYTVEGWSQPISCHKLEGHGAVSFRVGLQQSCNPTLMQVAERIGREKFYNYFENYGYTSVTGVDLPSETPGLYNDYSTFSNVSLAVYSFGQTFKTTPLQQLTALTCVAGGGELKTPHFLKSIEDKNGNTLLTYETKVKRQVISKDVCREIMSVLEEGVAGDGAAKNAYVKGYKVAAKTGTSEKKDKANEEGIYDYQVGSCAAFAPADDPIVSAIIMVDEPMVDAVWGSAVAAPYVSDMYSKILPYLGVECQYTEADLATIDTAVPFYEGGELSVILSDLQMRGIDYEVFGSGQTILKQSPAGGETMRKEGGKMYLFTESDYLQTCTVPDVMGMTGDVASMIILGNNLNLSVSGSVNGSGALVISQYPAAGTEVEIGTAVQIELRHLDSSD